MTRKGHNPGSSNRNRHQLRKDAKEAEVRQLDRLGALFAAEQQAESLKPEEATVPRKKGGKKTSRERTETQESVGAFDLPASSEVGPFVRGMGTPLLPEYRPPKGPFQTPSFTDISPVAVVIRIDREAKIRQQEELLAMS